MITKQYTIRSIPEPVDKALRSYAKKTGRSFNSVVVDALERATGTTKIVTTYDDLDHLIGRGIQDSESFDKATEWLDSLPAKMDQI